VNGTFKSSCHLNTNITSQIQSHQQLRLRSHDEIVS
jgi:hypothetical protein